MKDDTVYLKYILECIHRIEEDISGGHEMFIESHTYQDAVLRNLHTLTETTQRISDDLKMKYADIEWKSIAAFRNVLVHDYLGVDLDKVWNIVTEDVPALKKTISEILQNLEG